MMMSDLPLDLVEEILSRVSATSLKRLLSTCKQWNTLFKKQSFSQKHFHIAPKESMVLLLKEYRVCSMNINLNVSPPSVEFQGTLGIKDDSHSNLGQVEIVEVYHCDGLLLCATRDNRLVVWNPCLGETRWIQLKDECRRYSTFALGYENNKFCRRNYKILRYWGWFHDHIPDDGGRVRFEIYDFRSDSWKVLDDVPDDRFPPVSVVSLKGNTYWFGSNKKDFLRSFDFTTERFNHIGLPPSRDHGFMALSVVGEEQLSVLQEIETSKMEIFVTNKVGTEEAALLWSKSFIVDLPIGGDCSEVFASLLINEEKKVALCCNLDFETDGNLIFTIGEDNKYYSEIPYATNKPWWLCRFSEKSTKKSWWFPFIYNYVPSLVQIL